MPPPTCTVSEDAVAGVQAAVAAGMRAIGVEGASSDDALRDAGAERTVRDGVQILIHIGLDTVELKGDGFTVQAAEGDDVAVGDALVTADLQRLAELGKDAMSPVVVLSGDSVEVVASGDAAAGAPLLRVLSDS